METLFQNVSDLAQRKRMIADNANGEVVKSYMKSYTAEELQQRKEDLADCIIRKRELENELKEIKKEFKERIDPITEEIGRTSDDIKRKATLVEETVYRFTDEEDRTTKFFTAEGICIEARPATADELSEIRFPHASLNTGTND